MNVESAAHPEEILTWLNCFERSSLRWSSQQIIKSVQDKIRQQVYPNIYVLMQDFQKAHKRTREVYERAEVYLQFGLAFYQMGNSHSAIQLLRESVQNFVPGIGSYHKQAVARCMLGAVEWRNKSSYNEAAAHWKRSIREFEKLRGLAAREDILVRREWYTEHRATLLAALYKLKQLHAMI